MNSIFLVSVLVLPLAATTVQAEPCHDWNCGAVTVYLGPRWGSKVIRNYNYPGAREVRGTAQPIIRGTGSMEGRTDDNEIPYKVYRRPILPSSGVVIDNGLHYYDQSTPASMITPTRDDRWHTYIYGDINSLVDNSALNLSGLATTGDELKRRLSMLNDSVSPLVKTLYLEKNYIQSLPVLTFPVRMEYGLLELRLEDNPLPYLSTDTRFEISRLSKLKVLSLARTGLMYMDRLYLPSLEKLILSNNQLTSVPEGLSGLLNLRELYLDGNSIFEVYSGAPLADLHHLWYMSLANNRVRYVWAKDLHHINTLVLTNNSLESLYEVQESGVRAVYLDGNLMQCSCPLLDAIHTNQPQIIADRYQFTCILGDERVLAMSLTQQDVHLGCPGKWDWVKSKGRDLASLVSDHVVPRRLNFSTVFTFIGWLSIMVGVVLIVKSLRKSSNKRDPTLPPYNVLDDKNVI